MPALSKVQLETKKKKRQRRLQDARTRQAQRKIVEQEEGPGRGTTPSLKKKQVILQNLIH